MHELWIRRTKDLTESKASLNGKKGILSERLPVGRISQTTSDSQDSKCGLKLVKSSWAPEDQGVQQQLEMVLIEEQRFCQQSSCEIITESRSWNNTGSYQARESRALNRNSGLSMLLETRLSCFCSFRNLLILH